MGCHRQVEEGANVLSDKTRLPRYLDGYGQRVL